MTAKQADKKDEAPQPFKSNRPFSIIVWGATGFTGHLVCQHIANDYAGQVKWAMAGRSREKLEDLRKKIAEINPQCADIPILTADLNDPRSLDRLVKQSDVLISTAGPFWNIGTPVVEASLRNSTHYCDIAGEVHWMRKTTQTLHDAARNKNVKIVHSCGFDSIPSDLGTFMLADHMTKELERPCARVDLLVNEVKGGFSGGSLQSMFEQYMQPEEEIDLCADPYCLNPLRADKTAEKAAEKGDKPADGERAKKAAVDETDQFGPRYNKRLMRWTYPFQFAPINSRVVRRTHALLDGFFAPDFRYSEAHEAEGPIDAILGALGHTCVHLFTTVSILRAMIVPLLPKPGDGPPEAFRKKNHWKFTLYGWTKEEGRSRPVQCQAMVQGRRDPGYWETSRMVLESALCLALQANELKEKGYMQGGVLTPATAMGHVLIERLRQANVTFEITKTGKEKTPTPLDALKNAKGVSQATTITGAVNSGERVSAARLHPLAGAAAESAARGGAEWAKPCTTARSWHAPVAHCAAQLPPAVSAGMRHAHPVVQHVVRGAVGVSGRVALPLAGLRGHAEGAAREARRRVLECGTRVNTALAQVTGGAHSRRRGEHVLLLQGEG